MQNPQFLDLARYVPALITFLANKLSASASGQYRKMFGVGIVEWRVIALLAVEPETTANSVSSVIGLDKALVSRTVKKLKELEIIIISKSEKDGRHQYLSLSPEGKALHDEILTVALERESKLLEVLSQDERELLISLLQKLNNQVGKLDMKSE